VLHETFAPQLFDLQNDPNEFFGLGTDSRCGEVWKELYDRFFTWIRSLKVRMEIPSDKVSEIDPELIEELGIMIDYW